MFCDTTAGKGPTQQGPSRPTGLSAICQAIHNTCGMQKIFVTVALAFLIQSKPATPDLTHYFAGLHGTFVVLDGKTNQFIRYNPERAKARFSPCSTFKIPHTAILLESGAAPEG